MGAVADLELGLAEELVVGLGGQEPGELAQVVVAGRAERPVEPFGGAFLLGGQGDLGSRHREGLRERMTTKSGATHQRAPLYAFFHRLSRRSPPRMSLQIWLIRRFGEMSAATAL